MSWISVAKTSAKTRPLKPSRSLQQIRHLCASSKSCSWFILRREETPGRQGPSPELSLACVGRVLPVCSNHWIICLFPVPVTPPWFQGRFQVARVLLGWPKGLGPAESGSDNWEVSHHPAPKSHHSSGMLGLAKLLGGCLSVLLCWHSTWVCISFFVVLPDYLQGASDQHLCGLQREPCLLEHRHNCNFFKTCL